MSASVIRRQNWNCPSEPPARKGGVRKCSSLFYTKRRSCGLCVFSCQRKISIFLY